ncbi:MAG TPA: phage tail tape measure protein [Phycisphaerae bacterium]|nr:phage tail tape measure protein [Phycisphaerae bacterium]
MAIKLFDAVGYLRTDASAMKRGLEAARGSAMTVVGKIGSVFASFAKLAVKSFLAVGAAITGAVVAGLVQFGKLEKGIAEITTLFGKIGDEAPALRSELESIVQGLMTGFGQKLPDAIKGTYDAVSAGIRRADVGKFMQTAARLAVAGVTDIATSVDVLTSLVNAYGLSADDAEHVSDLLFTTVKQGKTTIEELSSAVGQLAPIAAGANVPLKDMLAALATMTKSGVSTRESVTGLRAVIKGMIAPTQEQVKAAKELGIQWDAQALKGKGLEGMFHALKTAAGGDVEALKKVLGEVEALNAGLIFTSETGFEVFRAGIDDMEASAGALDTAFGEMADTISFKWDRVKAYFTVAFEELGGIFGESFDKLLTLVLQWVEDNELNFQNFRDELEKVVLKLEGPVLAAFKWVLPKITGFIKGATAAMKDWDGTFGGLQNALDSFNANNFVTALKAILKLAGDVAGAINKIISAIRLYNAITGVVAAIQTSRVPSSPWEPGSAFEDGGAPFRTQGRDTINNTSINGVDIRIDGTDLEAESIANAVGEALLNLGRAGALSRGGIAVTP